MDPRREKLLNKIEGLLKLADADRNPSEEEAATAMRMARRLMLQHEVEMADLKLDEEAQKDWDFSDDSYEMKAFARWHHTLIHAIAHVTGTRWSYLKQGRSSARLRFYGADGDPQMATKMLAAFLAIIRNRGKMIYPGKKGGYNSYCHGYASILMERAREEFTDEETQGQAECFALVVQRKDTWLSKEMERFNFNAGRRSRGRINDVDAYMRGQYDGRRHAFGVRDEVEKG